MAGTTEGGRLAKETNTRLYGEDYYSKIGRMGGKKSKGGGFAKMDREKVREAGRKGGKAFRKKEKHTGWITWLTNGD